MIKGCVAKRGLFYAERVGWGSIFNLAQRRKRSIEFFCFFSVKLLYSAAGKWENYEHYEYWEYYESYEVRECTIR